MARALFLTAVLLLAAAATTHAVHLTVTVPVPAVEVSKKEAVVKVLVQNTASKALAVKVAELGAKGKEVIAKTGKSWTPVGTFIVSAQKNQVLHLSVTVTNDKGVPVTKELVLELLKRFKTELEGTKFLVIKAVEETKTGLKDQTVKLLQLWLDAQVVLTFTLCA